jgi:hypothetical protein
VEAILTSSEKVVSKPESSELPVSCQPESRQSVVREWTVSQ